MNSNLLPDGFFDIIPALMPRFARILENCELTIAEGFALSCVKHSDKQLGGRPVVLLSDLTHTLVTVIGYEETGGGAATVLTKLFDRGFLERGRLTVLQKKALFGQQGGTKAVVILRQEGAEKLNEFKTKFNSALVLLLSQVPAGKYLSRAVSILARRAIKSLTPDFLNSLHSLPSSQ
jgi:hypothetical protein